MTDEQVSETNPYEGVSEVGDAADALAAKWDRDFGDNPVPETDEPEQSEPTAEAEEPEPDSDKEQPETDDADQADETVEQPESDEPKSFTVTVNGEEKEVSLDDLRAGFMLQSDYTRKTQEIAEQRKQITEQQEQVQQHAEQQLNQLGFLVNQMIDDLTKADQGTNWEELRQLDPAEYAARREEMNAKREKLNQAYQLQQQHLQQSQQLQQAKLKAQIADEQVKMIGAIPAWSDPATREKETAELRTYLTSNGLSEEEVGGITDHRSIVIARKAMLYDQLQNKQKQTTETAKSKKLKDLPKVRAGTAQDPDNRTSKAQKAAKRLKHTGSLDDAVDWLVSRTG